jgi:hypothetical protein
MILAHTAWKIDTLVSLGVIVVILATSVVWSLVRPRTSRIPLIPELSHLDGEGVAARPGEETGAAKP